MENRILQQMDSWKSALITLLIFATLFPILSLETHWVPVSAQPPVTIDMTWVARNRSDIVTVTYIGFRLVNTADNTPFLGKLTLKDWPGHWFANEQGWCIIPVYSNEIANLTWTVDLVLFGRNEVNFTQTKPDPSIIFDKVQVELETRNPRIGVGSEATIQWSGKYMYDNTPFQGQIILNYENLTSSKVEKRVYTVEQIIDEVNQVTGSESNSVEIIYDRVEFDLNVRKKRISVGSAPDITLNARYQYDGAQFFGGVDFNDSLTKEQVGRYTYTIDAINDIQNDVTVFVSNAVVVIFDKVILEIDILDDRLDIGEEPEITWRGEYAYDKETFTGDVSLNVGSLPIYIPGRYRIYLTGIEDTLYDLQAYSSNTLNITWDRIHIDLTAADQRINVGDEATIDWAGFYEGDDSPFNGDVKILPLTIRRQTVGEMTYEATRMNDPQYGITRFSSDPILIVWDQVSVSISFPYERTKISTEVEPVISGVYQYDNTPFQGTVRLDEGLIQYEPGKYTFAVSSIDDPIHGLTEFQSNEASFRWDRIVVEERIDSNLPGFSAVSLDFKYESDDAPVENAQVYINGKLGVETEPGRYTSRIFNLSPILRVNARLESPGFNEEYAFGPIYVVGNIAAYLIAFAIIVVALVRLTGLRKRLSRGRS